MAVLPSLFAVDCSLYGGCKFCENQLRCLTTTTWSELTSGIAWGVDLSCNDNVPRRASCVAGGVVNGVIILRNFYNCYENGALVWSYDTGTTGGCGTAARAIAAKEYCEHYFYFKWVTGPFSCTVDSAISENVTVVGLTDPCPDGYFTPSSCDNIPTTETDEFGTKAMICE